MTVLRKFPAVLRLVTIVTGGAFLGACMTWQTESLQPERFRTADSTQAVRLTLTSGDTIVVYAPVITGDSLVGMRRHSEASADSLERVAIPLAAVSQAETKQSDPGANAAMGILALVGVVAIVAASCQGFVCSGRQ
jgi:hypothetical protein